MIVCSCNVLSDEEVRTAARMMTRRAASSVYVCLRCRVRCGRCTRTIREIMDKELDQLKCCSAHESDLSVASEVTQARVTEALKVGAEAYEGELEINYLSRLSPMR
jgi:bacterioferritin-associated ferredoxin